MSLNVAKCARFMGRVLVLIPTESEKYDGSHISIVYFAVLALTLLGSPVDKLSIAEYLDALWVGNGYKASISYLDDPSMASLSSTYFALAIRRMAGLPTLLDAQSQAILQFVEKCQMPDGQFRATVLPSSETSLRHTYSAHAIARFLDCTPAWFDKSCNYIISCQGYDGGFGDHPFDESHAGLTYCALSSLHISGKLHEIENRILSYLAKRQTAEGGHNGRPNKPTDVCYSFWVVASMRILGCPIASDSSAAAQEFMLGSGADELLGGFVKSPGAHADPYHTALALCALSLLGDPLLAPLDPVLTCTYTAK